MIKRILAVIVILLFISSTSMPAFAGTDTWVGTTNGNLGTGSSNWTGANNPPVSGDSLVFGAAGASGTSLTDTLASLNINGVTFNAGASAFTIAGSGANTFTLTGALNNNSSSNQILGMNIAGTINNTGTGTGSITLSGPIASTVTSITENSSTSTLDITSNPITIGSTTTLTDTAGQLNIEDGVGGTGNLVIDNNTSTAGGVTISGAAVNNTGNIINSGTSTGSTIISGGVGPNVANIIEDSTSSVLNITGAVTVGSTTTLTDTLGQLTISGGVNGTGNLVIDNNSTTVDGIILQGGTSVNNTGEIINSGTNAGGGATLISSIIGSNVTNVIEDSSTSALYLSNQGNAYTGTTTITAGTIGTLDMDVIPDTSDLSIANGGTLDVYGHAQNLGSLSGAGSVIDSSATAATLTTGTDNNSTTFSGTIVNNTGVVSIIKAGSGTFTLTGDNTYTGGTTINAGTIVVGNANALGNGAVTNNATLSLGTNALALGGVYTQNASSTLDLTADNSSTYGTITSTGHAAVVNAGSTMNVNVQGYIPNGAILTVINTGGTGVTGSANTVNTIETGTSGYAPRVLFVDSDLNGNNVLTADRSTTGFASLANNNNARALGNVLDNEMSPSTDLSNVLGTLESSSDAQTIAALNTLGPVVDRGVMDTTTLSLNNFVGASVNRAQNVLAMASSGNTTGISTGDDSLLNGLWAKQYGGYISQGTRDGIVGYNAWNTGTAVGLDHLFDDNLTVGASLGYAYGNIHDDANSATTYSDSAEGTIYAAYQGVDHPYFVDAAGTFANNWYEGQRSINIDNTINRTADSEYQGQQSGIYLDGGYKFDVGNNIVLTPLTSFQWTHLALGSYTETNAGDLDLMVNRQSYNVLESGLGGSISSQLKFDWANITPEFHAKWLYDFVDDNMIVTSQFTGGGASFTSTGASPSRDAVDVGASLTFDLKDDVSLIAGIDTEMRDNFGAVYGSVALRYKF